MSLDAQVPAPEKRRLSPRQLLIWGVFLTGVGIIVYSFLHFYPLAGINMGFGPLLLAVTPQTMMGRVQSVIETAMMGMSLVSIGLAGYFGLFTPVNVIFLVSGILITISSIIGWLWLPNVK
jgi:hypothetical protein